MSQATDSSGSGSHGLDTATYYGAIALAVFIVATVTIVSRIIYTRRRASLARVSDHSDRENLRRMYGGNADGLPTYRESQFLSRISQPAPNYPPPLPPPPPAHPPNGNDDSTLSRRLANKLHLSKLAKIIPLRSHHNSNSEPHMSTSNPTQRLSEYDAPPKYDDLVPASNSVPTTDVQSSSQHPPENQPTTSESTEPPNSENTLMQSSSHDSIPIIGSIPADEEFIHPEERRRNEFSGNTQHV